MAKVRSADGVGVEFHVVGSGPPVVLVGGAFMDAGSTAGLAAGLAGEFSAVSYHRRGRGGSGDAPGYAVEREFEDLAAVVEAVGGGARLYGMSSGGVLVLKAVAAGVPAERVAVYEPPFGDGSPTYAEEQEARIAAGDREGAVVAFLGVTGMPAEAVDAMRRGPAWDHLVGMAHTLPYDGRVVGDGSVPDLSAVAVPALVCHGGASPEVLVRGARTAAAALPDVTVAVLPEQTHQVEEGVLAPVLLDFYRGLTP